MVGMRTLKLTINSRVDLSQIVPKCVKELEIDIHNKNKEEFIDNSFPLEHTLYQLEAKVVSFSCIL